MINSYFLSRLEYKIKPKSILARINLADESESKELLNERRTIPIERMKSFEVIDILSPQRNKLPSIVNK